MHILSFVYVGQYFMLLWYDPRYGEVILFQKLDYKLPKTVENT